MKQLPKQPPIKLQLRSRLGFLVRLPGLVLEAYQIQRRSNPSRLRSALGSLVYAYGSAVFHFRMVREASANRRAARASRRSDG